MPSHRALFLFYLSASIMSIWTFFFLLSSSSMIYLLTPSLSPYYATLSIDHICSAQQLPFRIEYMKVQVEIVFCI